MCVNSINFPSLPSPALTQREGSAEFQEIKFHNLLVKPKMVLPRRWFLIPSLAIMGVNILQSPWPVLPNNLYSQDAGFIEILFEPVSRVSTYTLQEGTEDVPRCSSSHESLPTMCLSPAIYVLTLYSSAQCLNTSTLS